jgi:hypothetical protein
MMRTLTCRLLAGLLALSLVLPAGAQQKEAKEAAPQEEKEGEVQEKFIWGFLIQYAVSKASSYVFEVFVKWLVPKISGGASGFAERVSALLVRDSGAAIMPRGGGALVPAAATSSAEVVVGNPEKPFRVEGDQANYEGVHIALMMVEEGGQTFAFRPVNQGFRTGERFKLRVVSTFGGELTIENINPRGERRQIYPARTDQVVSLQKSTETLLPLGPDQFFQFTGATGRDQLVINVIDPRAVGTAASRARVYREDAKFGSNLLQESGKGTYPAITQAIELQHAAK